MRILVTNDDGVFSEGLWALVRELRNIAQVIVVAPDREQSAIGTAVSMRKPLKVQEIEPQVPDVTAYSVAGTPSDSVIVALGKLIEDRIDLVVSGINHGMNLGEDVHISGTVGAALQGYLRGFSAIAVSVSREHNRQLVPAARVAALLARRINRDSLPTNIFLNVNLPDLPPSAGVSGIKITRLADKSHVNTVEERDDGGQKFYYLARQRAEDTAGVNLNRGTDMSAIEQGYISITPLYFRRNYKPSLATLSNLCSGLFEELQACSPEPGSI